MNIATSSRRKGFTLVELLVVIAIIVALAALATPQIFRALKRAAMAEAVSNAKQVKLALDGFAMDFDGQFPNEDTAEDVVEGGTGTTYSNDFFRQLFLSGVTESEITFWVKNSPSAGSNSAPDDKVKEGGRMQPQEILQDGDVHWAYITDQTNLDSTSRPLLIDGYEKSTSEWDPDLWENKVIVVRIDGSTKPMRMRLGDGKVLDGSKNDILSSQADAWDGDSPEALLKQPQPGS